MFINGTAYTATIKKTAAAVHEMPITVASPKMLHLTLTRKFSGNLADFDRICAATLSPVIELLNRQTNGRGMFVGLEQNRSTELNVFLNAQRVARISLV